MAVWISSNIFFTRASNNKKRKKNISFPYWPLLMARPLKFFFCRFPIREPMQTHCLLNFFFWGGNTFNITKYIFGGLFSLLFIHRWHWFLKLLSFKSLTWRTGREGGGLYFFNMFFPPSLITRFINKRWQSFVSKFKVTLTNTNTNTPGFMLP